MVINNEAEYQNALNRISELFTIHKITNPETDLPEGSPVRREVEDLVSEIKIYENKYHPADLPDEVQEKTFEFYSKDKDGNDIIVKLKESELTQKHHDLLVAEFMRQFDQLSAQARRAVRKRLQY